MEIWPSGAWFGLTKPRLRWLAGGIAVSIAAALTLNLVAYGLLSYQAHRARTFLNELATVRLGQSESTVQPLLDRYAMHQYDAYIKAIGTPPTDHIVGVSPWPMHATGHEWLDELCWRAVVQFPGALVQFADLRRGMGLRLWETSGVVVIQNGAVTRVFGSVLVEGEDEWLSGEWNHVQSFSSDVMERYGYGECRPEMNHYLVSWAHLHMGAESGEVIRNVFTPEATPEEQQAAREFELSCLTRFRGCNSLSELMPAATRYRHAHTYAEVGRNSESWRRQSISCR